MTNDNNKVSIVSCSDYDLQHVRNALFDALAPINGLDFVKPGMRVAIKANLVAAMQPQQAGTTHPALLAALTQLLIERGASVIIGDSPGGLYTPSALRHVYRTCGLTQAAEIGAVLNEDCSIEQIQFPQGHTARQFSCTGYLCHVDAIINFCKLKTHGMLRFSGAVKNLFGTIPGTMKPEYHFRYTSQDAFCNMLIDLNEYFKPALCLCDAVWAMEGNGPTAGHPRQVGTLLASRSPYALDEAAVQMIGLAPQSVGTIAAARARGLIDPDALSLCGDAAHLQIADFQQADGRRGLQFETSSAAGRMLSGTMERLLRTRPALHASMCIGCGKCKNICPAHAITMREHKPHINRKLCIHCFCCQEFCPQGALYVHRSGVARLLSGRS
jgi:uncharacterized protein (DUF362 family)/Pyruvate/2-oxoacid:ferredoxin oxidoreductase delta subunit